MPQVGEINQLTNNRYDHFHGSTLVGIIYGKHPEKSWKDVHHLHPENPPPKKKHKNAICDLITQRWGTGFFGYNFPSVKSPLENHPTLRFDSLNPSGLSRAMLAGFFFTKPPWLEAKHVLNPTRVDPWK